MIGRPVFTNVSTPIRDDLLGMSRDENGTSSELMLSRPERLMDRYLMVGDSEISIQRHRGLVKKLSVRLASFI